MKPVIAMPEMGNGLFRKYMKNKYVKAVEKAGGQVEWIAWGSSENASQIAEKYDGLLLPGGDDINPAMYGMEKSEKCGKQHPQRDKLEPALFRAFISSGKPVLGICRGMQMINVCMGGTMHQDIKDNSNTNHSDFINRKKGNHTVSITDDTMLSKIVNNKKLTINSLHHQAVDKIGENLKVAAVSEDGFVEAVELPDHKFCLGVQWHPEHMAGVNSTQQKLITEFVNRCKK